jgi:cell filamentation protein
VTDPYALPNGVLANRVNITDADQLKQAEADITRLTLLRVAENPITGRYDLPHLQAFHRAIFSPVYGWAGELRTVEISKGTSFCPMANIVSYADSVFGELARNGYLRGLGRAEFVRALAGLYGDVNAIHPFREGNGRTQRAFLAQLANDAGYAVSWEKMDAQENISASVASFGGSNDLLERMLDGLVR